MRALIYDLREQIRAKKEGGKDQKTERERKQVEKPRQRRNR